MPNSEIRVPWEPLKKFIKELFMRVDLPEEDAEAEADVLLWANLRGVDSHGVLLVLRYLEATTQGAMNPRPNIQVLQETTATVTVEADRAFGPVVTVFTMKKVMEKAKSVGIGWGLIRATSHQGAMGYYSLMAARENMIGIAMVCGGPNMAVHGARKAGVANAPLAISVPAGRHRPPVLDMATSVAAGGKVLLAVDKGIPIPWGWLLDPEGNPTTDPHNYQKGGTLLPFGGPKGSGLAMMMECMSSLMVGNPRPSPAPLGQAQEASGVGQNSVVAAIDIGTFTDVETYKQNADDLIDGIKNLPKAEGVQEIFVPGEPEERVYDDRVKNGIPLPTGTVQSLKTAAEKVGIPFPFDT